MRKVFSLILCFSLFSFASAYAAHAPQNEWTSVHNHGGGISARAKRSQKLRARVAYPSKKTKFLKKAK